MEIDVWDGKANDDSSDDETNNHRAHHGIRERLGLKKSNEHQEEHHRSLKDRLLGHHESAKEANVSKSPESSAAAPADIMSQRITPWRSGIRIEPRVLHGQSLLGDDVLL